jgi:hypothetical protein
MLEAVLKISAGLFPGEKRSAEIKAGRPVFRRTAKNDPLIFALRRSGSRIFKTASYELPEHELLNIGLLL